jgi:hypothetical protein
MDPPGGPNSPGALGSNSPGAPERAQVIVCYIPDSWIESDLEREFAR